MLLTDELTIQGLIHTASLALYLVMEDPKKQLNQAERPIKAK